MRSRRPDVERPSIAALPIGSFAAARVQGLLASADIAQPFGDGRPKAVLRLLDWNF